LRRVRGVNGRGGLGGDPVCEDEVVAADPVIGPAQVDAVENRPGDKVVDIGQPRGPSGKDEIVPGVRAEVADPIGGGRPIVVRAAAVPGGDRGGEAVFQADQARIRRGGGTRRRVVAEDGLGRRAMMFSD